LKLLKNRHFYQQAAWLRENLGQMPAVSLFILLSLIVIAILANWIAPHSPVEGSLRITMRPPAWMEGGTQNICWERIGSEEMSSAASFTERGYR